MRLARFVQFFGLERDEKFKAVTACSNVAMLRKLVRGWKSRSHVRRSCVGVNFRVRSSDAARVTSNTKPKHILMRNVTHGVTHIVHAGQRRTFNCQQK